MNSTNFIDLSSDEESEEAKTDDTKNIFPLSVSHGKTHYSPANGQLHYGHCSIKQELEESRTSNNGSSITDQGSSSANEVCPNFASPLSVRLCRQFWKSGDYEVGKSISPISQIQNGHNRLCIHPKFLHSNATSHKWAFGAIAELLDNAIDEAQNGAAFVNIERFTNPRDGSDALLIQDDGGGMDPESLRRCMSFGFSDKQSGSSIGQYGNGFKTSTMRLGADVIVFSCCKKERLVTQSIGLLSYTFLIETGSDDIFVPTVDYAFDPLTDSFERLYRNTQKQFSSNLSTILQWSPFTTEAKLLEQFSDIGQHGTKIIVFNLWLNDEGDVEIDFKSDEKDIIINGAQRKVLKNNSIEKNYVANRLKYSLRAYISVLYLCIPEKFKIILCGEVVEAHYIANDLIYRECIVYRPQVDDVPEVNITVGFLEGSPNIDVHGFNVYHKKRLILPFWRVAYNSFGRARGKGIVGVLEANFIKPTHDKQDFENSILYHRLEARLKEMTYEYWKLHSHLVGYTSSKYPIARSLDAPVRQMFYSETFNSPHQVKSYCSTLTTPNVVPITNFPSTRQVFSTITAAEFRYSKEHDTGIGNHKRQVTLVGTTEMLDVSNAARCGSKNLNEQDSNSQAKLNPEINSLILENKKLHDECSEYEEMEKKLVQKASELRKEFLDIQEVYKKLLNDVESMDGVKMEKS